MVKRSANRRFSPAWLLPLLVFFQPACDHGSGSPTAPEPVTTQAACLDAASFGDPAASPHCLPFAAGSSFFVSQSYCADAGWSHHTRFAYDFDMPMGTEIVATRAGEVVELREHHPDADPQGGHENVVIVRHEDDTMSLYIHMRQDGIVVELGDFVQRGQLLGYSGQSGSSHPHLHYQVCLRSGMCSTGTTEVTLPVNFRNADGPLDQRGGLMAGETYTALPCN